MSVTETLMNEHQLILNYIALMERATNHPDTAILLANGHHFIDFIHQFADNFHHAKEEDSLFRYLGVAGVLTHCNPIPQMLNEHNQARSFVQTMEDALLKNDVTGLVTAMQQYARLLKEHIFKEDNILYPMAERGLSDSAKTALLNEYADTEQRLNSAEIWQRYQHLYTELADNFS